MLTKDKVARPDREPALSKDQLASEVEKGFIDTVVVAFTDMQGHLMGKRVDAEYFMVSAGHGESVEGCNYLLALDMEMDPIPGYQMANWESGYGDFDLMPDFASLRRIPWLDATALVLCDVAWHDGKPVRPSPRQVLRAVRKGMKGAGIPVESSKGEAWPGQQEINFRFSDAVSMADNHVIYKNGIKEMAHQAGCSVTFMAKPDHRWIGSSCHVHSSLWKDSRNAFDGESDVFKQYLAGHIAYASELAIFLAPNVNSYKRYAAGSWAPTTLAWDHDNRTCGFRIVGHGQHLRTESRIPGADVNPYLCFAALLAAGLHGIEEKLRLPPEFKGNAYESDVQRFPSSLREAIGLLENGSMARQAFGDDVIDHYLNYARTEQSLFDKVVTNYERERLFERG